MREVQSWILEYLLNSLWQVPLVFTVAWLLSRTVQSVGAAIEHRIWVAAILLQTLLPALSAHSLRWLTAMLFLLQRRELPGNSEVTVAVGSGLGLAMVHFAPGVSQAIAISYVLVIAYFTARLIAGVWITRARQRNTTQSPLPGAPAAYWQSCCHALGVRNARIAVSEGIAGPMTMGLRQGLVLLPKGMIEQSSADDLRAVFSHELAHIRRRDFTKNLFYETLALPVTCHPFSWLTRTRLIESREQVCDEIAAECVSGPQNYARSLLRLASMLLPGRSAKVPHAIGIFDANTFERRIMKLTINRTDLRGTRRLATLALCALCGLGTSASAFALHAGVYLPYNDNPGKPADSSKASPRVPAGVMAGLVFSKVAPVYPQPAKDGKVQGAVVLHAIIGKDGKVENLQVVSGPRELLVSALDAVRQWTYKPYLLNGEPTEVVTTITVTYSLSK